MAGGRPSCARLRGDGHVLASSRVGLDGLSTMVLRCGHDMSREVLQPNRGWGDLRVGGRRHGAGGAGPARPRGTHHRNRSGGLLAQVEEITDRLAQEPWDAAGHRCRRAVRRGGRATRPRGADRTSRRGRPWACLPHRRRDGVRRGEGRGEDQQADQREQHGRATPGHPPRAIGSVAVLGGSSSRVDRDRSRTTVRGSAAARSAAREPTSGCRRCGSGSSERSSTSSTRTAGRRAARERPELRVRRSVPTRPDQLAGQQLVGRRLPARARRRGCRCPPR